MTIDQFSRAIEINEEIDQMSLLKDKIDCSNYDYAISFICKGKDITNINKWQICDQMHIISDILKKHEVMIRKDIDEIIKILYKKIEEL